MKQKVYIDITIYDENMRKILKEKHQDFEKAIRRAENIVNRKIRM